MYRWDRQKSGENARVNREIQNKENEDVKLTKMTNKGIENEVGWRFARKSRHNGFFDFRKHKSARNVNYEINKGALVQKAYHKNTCIATFSMMSIV